MQELTPELIKQIVLEAIQEVLSSISSEWPRWLPTKEACRYSGLSKDTLYKLAYEGEIYAVKSPGGGKFLFDRLSIDEYLLKEKHQFKTHLDRLKRSLYGT